MVDDGLLLVGHVRGQPDGHWQAHPGAGLGGAGSIGDRAAQRRIGLALEGGQQRLGSALAASQQTRSADRAGGVAIDELDPAGSPIDELAGPQHAAVRQAGRAFIDELIVGRGPAVARGEEFGRRLALWPGRAAFRRGAEQQ
jgi:hypothetical protein